jgi:hypothetical protein
MNELIDILKMSPPMLLALALTVVGKGLKRSPIADWTIPLILPILGGIVYPFISVTTTISSAVPYPTVYNVLIGIACGGGAVGLNQAWRQVNAMLNGKENQTTNTP